MRRLRDRLRRWPSLDAHLARQRLSWHGGPTLVLSFDVELRADCRALPDVVRALAEHQLVASFACIGAWVDEFPVEHRAVAAAGHELMNHTDRHPSHDELDAGRRFDSLGDDELRAEIRDADRKLRALGASPVGFRSPHFGSQHDARVYGILDELGLRYSSSTISTRTPLGGAPFAVDGVWEMPVLACPRHPSSALDSWHCTTAPDAAHRDMGDLRRVYGEAIAALLLHRAYGSLYWDPRVLAESGYHAVLADIAASSGLRRLTYREVVDELESG